MFSDPDVYNKDADKYFRDVVRRTPNTYFPLIRLNEENDSQGQLKLSSLPGVDCTDDAEPEATLAAVVPLRARSASTAGASAPPTCSPTTTASSGVMACVA